MAKPANPKYDHLARPYALAAFEYARDKGVLPAWKNFLTASALITNNAQVSRLIANPEFPDNKLFELYHSILEKDLGDEAQKNYLHVLAQNKRLMLLPNISDLFDTYFEALERISNVRIVTAVDIEDRFKQQLKQALARRIQHEVKLNVEVNPALLGGAIIHIGDRVIDGSVRGKLTRLLNNLTS